MRLQPLPALLAVKVAGPDRGPGLNARLAGGRETRKWGRGWDAWSAPTCIAIGSGFGDTAESLRASLVRLSAIHSSTSFRLASAPRSLRGSFSSRSRSSTA
jgi:hypothetical protein